MANVLHRHTHEYRRSVNTPEYDMVDWVINPDLAAVQRVDPRYWFIEPDDQIREMTQAEKDAKDSADIDELRAAKNAEIASAVSAYLDGAVAGKSTLMDLLVNGSGARQAHIQPMVDWVETVIGGHCDICDDIDAATTRAALDAIAFDPAPYDATKPNPMPTVRSAMATR